jgi:hypothetical protein
VNGRKSPSMQLASALSSLEEAVAGAVARAMLDGGRPGDVGRQLLSSLRDADAATPPSPSLPLQPTHATIAALERALSAAMMAAVSMPSRTCGEMIDAVASSLLQHEEHPPHPGVQRAPVDYSHEQSIWTALATNDTRLVSAQWLCSLASTDGSVLPRRQDCPEEAFLSLEQLQSLHDHSNAVPINGCTGRKRLPVVVISHSWRSRGHPDPEGATLRLIADALRAWLPEYADYCLSDMGCFIDWTVSSLLLSSHPIPPAA